MHAGIWLNTRINMRCRNEIPTSHYMDNAFIQLEVKVVRVVRLHMGINTVEQEKELLLLLLDTRRQINRDSSGFSFSV